MISKVEMKRFTVISLRPFDDCALRAASGPRTRRPMMDLLTRPWRRAKCQNR